MKTKHLALALIALVLGLAPRAARADEEASFQYFYDTLSPLGEWVQVGDYGDCWHPTGVDADWAPYTDGYWSYTDAGWTWVSYEDFGGITYHYGRWVRTNEEGWCWVPDYEWGPAWVSWRNNEEAVGWAPLPPECRWRASIGVSTWCDDTYDIGPECYTFCPVVEFGAPLIRTVCYPRVRNVFFIGSTVNITNICYNSYSNVIFCGGPNFVFINQHAHRQIPAFKLVTNVNINRGGRAWTNARPVGNTLQVYAPKIVNNNTTIINKPKITKVINKTQINRGWTNVNAGEREKVRAQIKEQNHGLTAETAPAKPVKAEDLKHVPEKADPKAPSPIAITNNGKGKDRNGDGIPDNQENKGGLGKGNGKVAGQDRNGDGIPDNQENKGGPGKGNGKVAGQDRNGDGVPDNQENKGGLGKGNGKVIGQDRNGDGIPDNQEGNMGKGKGPKVGPDRNGDGIPDNPNRGQGGFQGPGEKKPKGQPENGGFVPNGKGGNNEVEQGGKHSRDAQLQQQQQEAERQQRLLEQQQRQQHLEKQQQQADRAEKQQQQAERADKQQQMQQRQAEAQQRAIEAQRNQQIQRQEIQRQRQQEVQRQPQPQPQPQQGNNGGGGGGGKGKKQLTPEEIEALKKQRGGN